MKLLKRLLISVLIIGFLGCQESALTEVDLDTSDPEIVTNPISNPVLYSFFVAGHTYGKPVINNIGLHPPFRDKFDFIKNEEFMDFGVLTGDVVLSGTEQNWNEVDLDINLIDHPVHFAVGNHDMTNRDLFESRYGSTYKSFKHNSDLFIILDPNLDNWNISGEQLQFLKNTLDLNHQQVENIYVFFHQLLWWSPNNIYQNISLNSLSGRDDNINFWTEVEPLFNSLSNEVFMFSGDAGAFANGFEFMHHNYDNITLIATGMGGESRDNFVIVDVLEDKTTSFRLIALNGDDINSLGKLEDYEIP